MHLVCAMVNQQNDVESIEQKYTLVPGILTMSFGDCHVYESHVEAVREQLQRKPYSFPTLTIDGTVTLDTITNISVNSTAKKAHSVDQAKDDQDQTKVTLHLSDYKHYSSIKANMIA